MTRFVSSILGFAILVVSVPSVGAEPGIERSVVRIVNHSQRGDWYAPWNASAAHEESGSGFVIEGGRVMTNAHVVSDLRMCILYLHGDPTPHQARVAAIGHDCDLALLEPLEPGLLDAIPPVTFGGLPALRSTVETYGYPTGGRRLSSTRGVVSRIELLRYVHSGLDSHLAVQTDAAINPGNSGGPVVQDGMVVGVAFQGASHLENVGFFIPNEVVEHFLKDVADGAYDGYPELGAVTANLENPAARRAAGMTPDESGVSVQFIFPGSSADGYLHPGDVLMRVQGRNLANDGTVAVDGLRFGFGVLVDRLQQGDTLTLGVLQDGRRVEIAVPMRAYPPHKRYANLYDQLPRYYIYAGLVFLPLDREVLKTYGGQWAKKADKSLIYEFFYRFYEEPERLTKEPVVLLRCLDHPVNMNLPWRKNLLVERVNGQPVDGLAALAQAIETNEDRYHVIEFGHPGRFSVLDREEADRAHAEILTLYGVYADRRL